MQQLTCNIDLSRSFYYIFFSFVLIELKPFVLKGESPGGQILKKCEKVRKSVKNSETILPFTICHEHITQLIRNISNRATVKKIIRQGQGS